MRLLLAEDDVLLGQATCKALMQLGYAVDWLTSGVTVVSAIQTYAYDCVLLDLGLPEVSGQLCIQALRKSSRTTPVIVLTAREETNAKVEMLDLGADDYIVKPFDVDELAARIRAVARRSAAKGLDAETELAHGHLRINPAAQSVSLGSEHVRLTNKEFWLLEALMRSPGRIVTRQSLEDALYGWNDDCSSNAIEVLIYQLRKKLATRVIHTVRGVGYRLASLSEMNTLEIAHVDRQ
jgi:DNA-binding response OmpR family regulator